MSDPAWSNVKLLLGFEGGTALDESASARGVLTLASASVSSAQAAFGTKSLLLAGGQYAKTASAPNIFAGSDPFTIEGWFRMPSPPVGDDILVSQWDASGNVCWALSFYDATTLYFFGSTTGTGFADVVIYSDTVAPTTNTWHHIACDFDGTNYRFYFDGANVGSSTPGPYSLASVSAPISVGAEFDNAGPPGYGYFAGYADEIRLTAGEAVYATDGSFTPPTAAFPRSDLDAVLTDTVVFFDAAGEGNILLDALADTAHVAPSAAALQIHFAAAADMLGISPLPDAIFGVGASLTDTVALTDVATALTAWMLTDVVAVIDDPLANGKYNAPLADIVSLVDQLAAGWNMSLSDALAASDALTVYLTALVQDAVGVGDVPAPAVGYHLALQDALTLLDVLDQHISADLAETISITPALSVVWQAMASLAEMISITPSTTPLFLLSVAVQDSVEITPDQAAQMLYGPTLEDAVLLTAGYIEPNGGVTTWAVNTRSGAVSEYDNYAFNSFARLGNKYVGASDAGLYELLGDSDAGHAIVATLKGGFLQFGGTHLSRLKAAYIAARGVDGGFVLKIETLDDKTYTYETEARSGRSTKVHMGKGQRARYFAWELVSAGQDFDLGSLEFVPIVVARRV